MSGTLDIALRGQLGEFSLDAAFTVPARGVTALFGPSGCGKTTVLRGIAGLTRLDGHCRVDDLCWQDKGVFTPPHRRAIGYVFQEPSLFPHLSVRKNLTYGMAAAADFDHVTELLGVAHLLDRAPQHLSGGERQRVAIGRALLSAPRLLLMDEPLSALDRQSKDDILPFLERLHHSLALPIIYISHDRAEVERLADHLILMEKGRVIAAGPLAQLQADPALPLARGQAASVTLAGTVAAHDMQSQMSVIGLGGGQLLVPGTGQPIGMRVRLTLAADDISLSLTPQQSTIVNIVPVTIVSASALSATDMLVLLGFGDATGDRFLARITRQSWQRFGFLTGQKAYAQIKGVALSVARE